MEPSRAGMPVSLWSRVYLIQTLHQGAFLLLSETEVT